ncbi:MAG: hypothetical protein U1A72_09710 [Sulfuritalea sp.]|nr:hypothetical protein [Hyphomicrobiales bacterium]MDZ4252830.1 hypothetical protein [Sulfuritalea sp.]
MGVKISVGSVTRPNNATPYTEGDVVGATVGDAMEFSTEQFGRIRGALLIDSIAAVTRPSLDLMLFENEPTIAADNDAFAITDAQMLDCAAVISFDGTSGANFKLGGANGVIQQQALDIPYCTPDKKLYGVLVARNAYTPTALEVFTVKLLTEQGA